MYYDVEIMLNLMKWTVAAGIALMAVLLLYDRWKASTKARDEESRHMEILDLLRKIEANTRTGWELSAPPEQPGESVEP